MRIVLTWAVWRRPKVEQSALLAVAGSNQTSAVRQKKVQTMTQTIAQALIAEGEANGQLRASRTLLRRLLAKKFGSVPDAVSQRIEAVADLERLQACVEQVVDMQTIDE